MFLGAGFTLGADRILRSPQALNIKNLRMLFVSDPVSPVMLARGTSRCAPSARSGAGFGSARNMATLREIELRLKSIKNIEKITKFVILLNTANEVSEHPIDR
jgi:hypothetical protein